MDRQTEGQKENKNPCQSVLIAPPGRTSCVLRTQTHTRQATSVFSLRGESVCVCACVCNSVHIIRTGASPRKMCVCE